MFEQFKEITGIMHQALNGLSTRQKTIVNNIANADTPNFKGSEVLFEDQLQEKMKLAKASKVPGYYTHAGHLPLDKEVLSEPVVVRVIDSKLRNDKNNIDVDLEMAKQAQTNMNYTAVAQMLTAKLSGIKSIISEGGQ